MRTKKDKISIPEEPNGKYSLIVTVNFYKPTQTDDEIDYESTEEKRSNDLIKLLKLDDTYKELALKDLKSARSMYWDIYEGSKRIIGGQSFVR